MTTLNITLPTGKKANLAVYTIQFSIALFDQVIEKVSEITTYEELTACNLWIVK